MLVEQIWTANAYRNFNYLIACPETGEALAIDPLDHRQCLATAKRNGWQITQIVNTHEHGDHTGGNEDIIAQTKGKLLAHHKAQGKIRGIDKGLAAGDVVKVGDRVELKVLDTPGHTLSHLCLFAPSNPPALFCGDTLFNAGAGNCHNGGDPSALYITFTQQLALLPGDTRIYPGHEYIENNLRFTLDREPDNEQAMALLSEVKLQDPGHAFVSTLALEKEINTFFRLGNPAVIRKLQEALPDLPTCPDPKTVFLKLRELRNKW